MYVGLRMNKNPVTVSQETGLDEAVRLMKENKVRQLMVLKDDKLVGIVSDVDLQHVLPSPATTLSIYELTYLLSKLNVGKFMVRNVVTIAPDATIEEAAVLMHDKDISGLPVVRDKNKLVGYINRTMMLELFVEEMGQKVASSRIAIELEDKPGQILEITRIVKECNLNIVSLATFFEDAPNRRIIVLRVGTTDPSPVEKALKANGYRIVTAKDFNL